jgi:hypothetical protein
MSKTHLIKALPEYWDALANGSKTFEVRFADRPYAVGDVLEIHRATHAGLIQLEPPADKKPAPLLRRVTYVLPGGIAFGGRVLVDPSAVVMGLKDALAQDQDAKADKLMIEHLRETLDSIRDQIAVELSPDLPNRQKMVASMIAQIDEALDT